MKEMLLLGAGASVEAKVPAAYKMTERIAEIFRESPQHKIHSRVIAFVVGGLLFKRGIEGSNALTAGVNVEELFNAVQLLAERGTLEAAPFVGSWHSMVEELDKIDPPALSLSRIPRAIQDGVAKQIKAAIPNHISSFAGRDIDRNLETNITKTVEAMVKNRNPSIFSSDSLSRAVGKYVEEFIKKWTDSMRSTSASNYELERELEKLADQQPRPGGGRVFEDVGEQMIRTLVEIVWIEDAKRIDYLRPIFSLQQRQSQLTVATLNYDNSVELAARDSNIRCETAIDGWSQTGEFSLTGDGVLLLKLHGSIDWALKESLSQERPMPHSVISPVIATEMKQRGFRPAVVFGHRNKLTAEGPFLDLLRAFRRELEKAELLTIVGYSFGDPHINVFITNWLNGLTSRKIRIVNPSFGECKTDFANQLRALGANRIEIISENTGTGLKILYGDFAFQNPVTPEQTIQQSSGN
jgi:hypothetical protein